MYPINNPGNKSTEYGCDLTIQTAKYFISYNLYIYPPDSMESVAASEVLST